MHNHKYIEIAKYIKINSYTVSIMTLSKYHLKSFKIVIVRLFMGTHSIIKHIPDNGIFQLVGMLPAEKYSL